MKILKTSISDKRGMAPIIAYLIILIAIVIIGGATVLYFDSITPETVQPQINPQACTEEAKLCPDGSYVGRTGPNCQFAPCPGPVPAPTAVMLPQNCTSDSQCPSSHSCQAIQGTGTVYPGNDQSSAFTITQGECKLKSGNSCNSTDQCLSGLVCHAGACTEPVAGLCSGANDTSCGPGYQCVQDCGPPVVRGDEPPPAYHCVVDEVANEPRNCPICLASNAMIDTPSGERLVSSIIEGDKVWSVDGKGKKIASAVSRVVKYTAPSSHKVAHFLLEDSRELWVSANHPLTDGKNAGDLRPGDSYDGSIVDVFEITQYWDGFTYDILPDSATGFYWANNILLASTLK